MERRSKVVTIGMLAVCIVAVVASGFAQSQRGARAAAPPRPAATPAGFKAPARTERGKVVGICNTVKGCMVLKKACLTIKGHTFNSTGPDGSSGTCVDDSQRAPHNPAADVGLTTPQKVVEATLYCNSVALCTKVKN